MTVCPYCDKAESSILRHVAPFCSDLHKTAFTRGCSRKREEKRLQGCAPVQGPVAHAGLVHIVKSIGTTTRTNDFYLQHVSEWRTLCGERFNTYPPKTTQAVSCWTCLCEEIQT